jgi:polyhydroxyalkanoate synthesis regulator phasin
MAKSNNLLDLIIDDMMNEFNKSTYNKTLIKQIKILLDERANQRFAEFDEQNVQLNERITELNEQIIELDKQIKKLQVQNKSF